MKEKHLEVLFHSLQFFLSNIFPRPIWGLEYVYLDFIYYFFFYIEPRKLLVRFFWIFSPLKDAWTPHLMIQCYDSMLYLRFDFEQIELIKHKK